MILPLFFCFFFFNDTATTEIYTLSLHDALPISDGHPLPRRRRGRAALGGHDGRPRAVQRDRPAGHRLPEPRHEEEGARRSEEHTSELQSRQYLVCRLLLEKKTNAE